MNELSGQRFRLLQTGGLRWLGLLIISTKIIAPGTTEIYPACQGMQYMRNMIDKRATLQAIDNKRYPYIKWTPVKDILSKYKIGL